METQEEVKQGVPEATIVPRPPEGPKKSRPASRNHEEENELVITYEKMCEKLQIIPLPTICAALTRFAGGELNFDEDYIGNTSLIALCPSLAAMSNLEGLSLAHNGIRNEGCEALCDALRESNIKRIDLRDNRICDSGARRLLQLLSERPTLHTIVVDGNPISPRERLRIKDLCLKRRG